LKKFTNHLIGGGDIKVHIWPADDVQGVVSPIVIPDVRSEELTKELWNIFYYFWQFFKPSLLQTLLFISFPPPTF
jgi:hypothetical protein